MKNFEVDFDDITLKTFWQMLWLAGPKQVIHFAGWYWMHRIMNTLNIRDLTLFKTNDGVNFSREFQGETYLAKFQLPMPCNTVYFVKKVDMKRMKINCNVYLKEIKGVTYLYDYTNEKICGRFYGQANDRPVDVYVTVGDNTYIKFWFAQLFAHISDQP